MFKKKQNLKGLTVTSSKAFVNNVPTFRSFCLWTALTYHGINFKITNLIYFNKPFFGNSLTRHL